MRIYSLDFYSALKPDKNYTLHVAWVHHNWGKCAILPGLSKDESWIIASVMNRIATSGNILSHKTVPDIV